MKKDSLMSKHPPNFRFVETKTCMSCWGSVSKNLAFVCERYEDFVIAIPNNYVCDKYELERDESYE